MKATILSASITAVLAFAGTAGLCVQKSTPLTASASTPAAQLISPTSYEQYLPLTAPTSIAATDKYTAIADGKTIHVYDRAAGVYREYTHTDPVSQIVFDNEDNLYFLSEFELYQLSTDTLESTPLHIVCSGFTIEGDTLYYYAMSKTVIKRYSLTENADKENLPLSGSLQDNSPLTFGNGYLHYVCKNGDTYTVYAISTQTASSTPVANFNEPLKSIAIASNLFCAVTESEHFYTYNYKTLSESNDVSNVPPITDTSTDETDIGGYVSIHTYQNEVYAVRGNAVRHYLAESAEFTDFEISAASASPHRFNGANDIFLAENKLFIADDGNDRISVYNTDTATFEKPINSTLPTPFLTSYENTLLVSSAQEAVLYSLADKSYGEELLRISDDEIDGTVIGAACVYDRYYLLTDGNYCYTFTAENGAWGYTESKKTTLNTQLLRATAFTADVYGSLYVTYDNGAMYRFTERELVTSDASGTKVLDGLTNAEKIAVDYDTDFYALSQGTLTKYSLNDEGMYALNTTYTPNYGLVKDDSPLVTSFTFGVENEYAYFLYKGNYAVKTDELQIPIVSPIPVGDAENQIFGADNREFALVTIQEDAILTEFDVAALKGATEFPYIAFERCQEPLTALKIGEQGGYAILAVEQIPTGYKTYLVLDTSCVALSEADYRIPCTEADKIGYLTNEIPLYKFPYLTDLLTVETLQSGAKVTLLGEVTKLHRAYYEIAYTAENGEMKTGFVPKAYVNLFDGTSPTAQTVTYGETADDSDSVWRFAYIILGFGAIGILVDFLLLKKPKETDEN